MPRRTVAPLTHAATGSPVTPDVPFEAAAPAGGPRRSPYAALMAARCQVARLLGYRPAPKHRGPRVLRVDRAA